MYQRLWRLWAGTSLAAFVGGGTEVHGRRHGDGASDWPCLDAFTVTLLRIGALVAAAMFGAGLVVSGKTDPERVLGFSDIFGQFDSLLLFVLGVAVFVTLITFGSVCSWEHHGLRRASHY
jgi:hypothetical protein